MLQGALESDSIYFLLDRFGAIVVLSVLFWLAIHELYKLGALGPWPPSNRGVRVVVWIFFLFPLVIGLGLTGILLLLAFIVPSLDAQLVFLSERLELLEYLLVIVVVSLIFFRILWWCWRGYGTTGVIVIVSLSVSVSLAFYSLGLSYSIGPPAFEFGLRGWRISSIFLICWLRDLMKPKSTKASDDLAIVHARTEVSMRNIYSIIVPLARRVRVDRDESALRILQNVLQMDSGLERTISLACKALGFDRVELINASDAESASVILRNAATDWGNFSRIDVIVLFILSAAWAMSGLLTVWAHINGVLKQNFLFLALSFVLPVGIAILHSLLIERRPGREYDLAKRHDERFRFTQSEYSTRRMLDMVILVIALVGATCAGILIVVLGDPSLVYLVAVSLSFEYVLTIALVRLDSFTLGRRMSDEQTLALLRKKLLDSSPPDIETTGPANI